MSESEISKFLRRQYYKNIGHEDTLTCRGTPRKTALHGPGKSPTEYSRIRRARLKAAGLTANGTPFKNPAGRPAVC